MRLANFCAAMRRDETGSNMVEFALCATILFLGIFGVIAFSQALYADHFVANAARDATRYAIVRGSAWKGTSCSTTATLDCDATSTDVTNYVKSTVPGGITSANLNISTTWTGLAADGTACTLTSGTNSAGCVVQVKVSYPFGVVIPLFPKWNITLVSTAAATISQ